VPRPLTSTLTATIAIPLLELLPAELLLEELLELVELLELEELLDEVLEDDEVLDELLDDEPKPPVEEPLLEELDETFIPLPSPASLDEQANTAQDNSNTHKIFGTTILQASLERLAGIYPS
jgi:hypothetical protein